MPGLLVPAPTPEFKWSADNFGSSYNILGTSTPAHASSANVKGTATALIAGSSVTQDVFGMAIGFCSASTSAAVRAWLTDILIDPDGGTNYSTLIANLIMHGADIGCANYWYYFPVWLKAGTQIAAQAQCSTAGLSMRCAVKVFGKPARPELVRVGTKVQSYGPNTSTSMGATISPGNAGMGSYTSSLGTSSYDQWWWQAGMSWNDTTLTALGYLLDIAVGDGSNKQLACENIMVINTTAELCGKSAIGSRIPILSAPSGAAVYARAACLTGAADSNCSVAAYGLGG